MKSSMKTSTVNRCMPDYVYIQCLKIGKHLSLSLSTPQIHQSRGLEYWKVVTESDKGKLGPAAVETLFL